MQDLWDATPGVCCAAYQLGACPHTEDPSLYEDEEDMTREELVELYGEAAVAEIERRMAAGAAAIAKAYAGEEPF